MPSSARGRSEQTCIARAIARCAYMDYARSRAAGRGPHPARGGAGLLLRRAYPRRRCPPVRNAEDKMRKLPRARQRSRYLRRELHATLHSSALVVGIFAVGY